MTEPVAIPPIGHSHVFLGASHARAERKSRLVIGLCGFMMVAEIVRGAIFGSLALMADGLHMSTHAAALLIAALAYSYARRHANDRHFVFGTGKLGDLAGFSSAIVLGLIALLIGYEAARRLLAPVPIDFNEAIPIACLGLAVNIASAWLLFGGEGRGYEHHHGGVEHRDDTHHAARRLDTGHGVYLLEIFENGAPHFRLHGEAGSAPLSADAVVLETERPDGARQDFTFAAHDGLLESRDEIPEPHEFTVRLRLGDVGQAHDYTVGFSEQDHQLDAVQARIERDNNLRAAFVHVLADAAVSVLAIIGLTAGKLFGWIFMDAVMGIVGAAVIANWAFGLMCHAGGVLLDMKPDGELGESLREAIEAEGDRVSDLHLWRLGPGHLGAIVSVVTETARGAEYYRARLARFRMLSHLTVEVRNRYQAGAVTPSAMPISTALKQSPAATPKEQSLR